MIPHSSRLAQRTARLVLSALFLSFSLIALDLISRVSPLPKLVSVSAQTSTFRFVAWSDTHNDPYKYLNNAQISTLSNQIITLNPDFTVVAGDLEDNGFDQNSIDVWKSAVNGEYAGDGYPNGLFDRTFPSRGNHDIQTGNPGWQTYFNLRADADGIGATNYSYLPGEDDRTYSFDYGNSHIVSLDVPGRFDEGATSARLSWLDSDLAEAESRYLTHAFLFFHGAVYCIQIATSNMCPYCPYGARTCSMPSLNNSMVTVINKHPILSAIFNGHEGTSPYTHVDSSRIPSLTHPFEQFLVANTSYDNDCRYDYQVRYDYCPSGTGFLLIDVSGPSFTASWYATNRSNPIHTSSFAKPTTPTPTPSPTETGTPTPTATPTFTPTPPDPPLTVAVLGDYGSGNGDETNVANLIKSWGTALIVTTGDDYYAEAGGSGDTRYDNSTGKDYCPFLAGITTSGTQCPQPGGSSINKFFPSLGDHDYQDAGTTNNLPTTFTDYFDLPGAGIPGSGTSGNERYYDFVQGPVHFFILNSNNESGQEPDGTGSTSVQATWLKSRLAASTSPWNTVLFHHPPYSSGSYGNSTWMQWPFAEWGADVVMAGHSHNYERILQDGIVYFVNGLGGESLNSCGTLIGGSQFCYDSSYGAQRIVATDTTLDLEFITTDGVTRDTQHLQIATVPTPTPTQTSTPTPTVTSTGTPTFRPTPSRTPTFTPTPSRTPTFTPTPSRTPTFTPTSSRTPTFTPTPVPGNLVVNGEFENWTSPWVQIAANGANLIGKTRPHAGSYSAWLGGYHYGDDQIYQTITIPDDGTLTYWWYLQTQESSEIANDKLYVRLYDTSGTMITTLRTWSNTSTKNVWSQDSLSLASYAGRAVRLYFSCTTNGSLYTNFFLDDIILSQAPGFPVTPSPTGPTATPDGDPLPTKLGQGNSLYLPFVPR